MKSRAALRTAGVTLAVAIAFVAACSFVTDLDGLATSGPDASADGSLDAPPVADDFTLALTPTHVTTDLGDVATTVGVTVIRGSGFKERVSFQVTGLPPQYISVPPDVDVDATTSSFLVGGIPKGSVVAPDLVVTVRGTGTGGKSHAVPLGLRVGSLLPIADGGVITIPDFAYAIDVKAWGAGGGGGGGLSPPAVGANGGAGGFASARFLVTPNSTRVAVAGTGGSGSYSGGGGGGGFSGLRDATGTYWLIVGGGGGGSFTGTGGAGGGATGASGAGCGPGLGGTQLAGGAAVACSNKMGDAGASLVGGDARGASAKGGVPGGGRGGQYGGGGGGGYFGGGGGAGDSTASGGGGGGSGHALDGGADATLTAGSNTTPPATTDPDYAAGVAVGGAARDDVNAIQVTAGGNGRVIVHLAKP